MNHDSEIIKYFDWPILTTLILFRTKKQYLNYRAIIFKIETNALYTTKGFIHDKSDYFLDSEIDHVYINCKLLSLS